MPIAVKKIAPSWYVLEDERDDEQPTRFKVQPLSSIQYLELTSEAEEDKQGDMSLTGRGLIMAAKYGLVGWENFYDERGKPVKFSPHNIAMVPPLALAELAGEILTISSPDDAEKKP